MSVTNVAKRRGTILDEIMSFHRENLPKIMRETPLENVRAFAQVASPPVGLLRRLESARRLVDCGMQEGVPL